MSGDGWVTVGSRPAVMGGDSRLKAGGDSKLQTSCNRTAGQH